LGDIASYIGVSQVTLSRIRAKKWFFNIGKKITKIFVSILYH
jgi:hypothetical protein